MAWKLHFSSADTERFLEEWMKRLAAAMAVLFLLTGWAPGPASGRDVTTVKGKIESVSGDSIYVGGRYYYVTDAPLVSPSGQNVPASRLKQGTKVEIFFEGGRIKSVLVYDEGMLE